MSSSGFDAFGLPPKLAHALTRIKFTEPTPIQAQTIPLALQGRDILGSAQTGTGKTGAFGIPVIAGLMENPAAAALIMTPTRELAGQVMKALEPMIPVADIHTALLIGGEAMPRQMNQLRHNPRLIVGTPGRINDHLDRGSLKLGNVRFLVLDETDRMLDMGFGIQIEAILKHVPDERQTLLFSATLPHNINKLSGRYMKDPARVAVGSTVTPAAKIKQEVVNVTDAEKYAKLVEQIEARQGSIIVFVKTKWGTERLADRLNKDEQHADAIHGDLQQRRRERVIRNFREKKYRILVATDVAARGLDIPHIAHVINYDMPQAPEDYIHRIGRTARAGAEGEAISFVTPADNQKWRAIQRLMNGEDPNAPAPRSGGTRSGGARSGGRGGPSRFNKGGGKPFWKKDDHRKPHGEHASEARQQSSAPKADAKPAFHDKAKGEVKEGFKPKAWGGKAKFGKSSFGKPSFDRSKPADHAHEGKKHEGRAHEGKSHKAHKPQEGRSAPSSQASPGERRAYDAQGQKSHGYKKHGDKPFGAKAGGAKTGAKSGGSETGGKKHHPGGKGKSFGSRSFGAGKFGTGQQRDKSHRR